MKELFDSYWYLIETQKTILNIDGWPESHYECYISTSPEKKVGYTLANLQRWGGPTGYNGAIEQSLGRHIVELHNEFVDKVRHEEAEAIRKSKTWNTGNLQRWPKGVPRKRPDGTAITYDEAVEIKAQQEAEGEGVGTVPQEQSVQAESGEVQKRKAKAQTISTTSALGMGVDANVNQIPAEFLDNK